MAISIAIGETKSFDPYPFILLNLVLSCLAAIQAPIIMMSQKRQEAKDRLRSRNDYQVNLKAELEIQHLHEKLDHLIIKQWQRLAEIQQIQAGDHAGQPPAVIGRSRKRVTATTRCASCSPGFPNSRRRRCSARRSP